MLRITTSQNATKATNYYNLALSKQDYYTENSKENVTAQWHGKAAEKLGLHGQVTKEQFEKLVNNRNPNTNEKLTPKDSSNRRAGYDFTFNAPKSVSIAHAINGDPKLLAAHDEAVRQAMTEVEANMQTQNSKRGEDYVTTGNAVYAIYQHDLSRPVAHTRPDGSTAFVPDCHLHSHSYLFNVTHHEKQDKFKAVEIGNIKKEAPYYEAYYHAVFRQEVLKAGYEIERTKKGGWELKIIDRATIEAFSNRTKEINEKVKEKGITNAKIAEKFGTYTRQNKNKSASQAEVKKNWQDRLTLAQKYNINGAAGKGEMVKQKKTNEKDSEKLTPKIAVDLALRHHLQNNSSISQKRVLGDAMKKGNFAPDQIKKALKERDDILGYDKNTRRIITTRETLNAEKSMIRYAAQEQGKYKPLNAAYEPKSDNPNHDLNEGQKKAVKQILNSSDGVQVLEGKAGTGKTTISKQIKEGVEQSNKKMFAFAPSTAARDELTKAGFDAHTIKKLMDDKSLQQSLNGQVMFIDEAGMIGVKSMNGIFDISKEQGCKVILSGDPSQHHAIEAGSAQALITKRCGIKPAIVSEVVRQKNEQYKKAIEDLADGKTAKGFEKLRDMGAVKEIEDDEKRYEQLANDYLATVTKSYVNDKGKTVHTYTGRNGLIVSPTHREGAKVNSILRQKLKELNLIKGKEHKADILRPMHYTDVQKQDGINFENGMIVRMHYNKGAFKAGTEHEVIGRDKEGRILVKGQNTNEPTPLPLDNFKKFSVYEKSKTAFAVGDTIQLTSNMKAMDGRALNNGNRYKIAEITKEGNRVLDNGSVIPSDQKFLKHGLYSTSMSAQGKTADAVFIAQNADNTPANNQKQFYVSSSRGVKSCRVYTNNANDLLTAIKENDGSRESAHDVAEKAASQEIQHSWELATKEVELYNSKYSDYGRTKTHTERYTRGGKDGEDGFSIGSIEGSPPPSARPE